MKNIIFAILGLIIGISLIGAVLTFLSSLIGITFGLVGSILGFVFSKLFTPAVLVLIIIILAYKLNKKKA